MTENVTSDDLLWPQQWLLHIPCHVTYQMKGNDFSIRPFNFLDQLEVIWPHHDRKRDLRWPPWPQQWLLRFALNSHSPQGCLMPSCIFLVCLRRFDFPPNALSQKEHLKFWIAKCTVFVWNFRLPICEKSLPQCVHLYCLSLWTTRMWSESLTELILLMQSGHSTVVFSCSLFFVFFVVSFIPFIHLQEKIKKKILEFARF